MKEPFYKKKLLRKVFYNCKEPLDAKVLSKDIHFEIFIKFILQKCKTNE